MRLQRFAVPALIAGALFGGTLALSSSPASAATCVSGAKLDRNGRWHNPDGEFCAAGSTTVTIARPVPVPTTMAPSKPATHGAVVVTPRYTG